MLSLYSSVIVVHTSFNRLGFRQMQNGTGDGDCQRKQEKSEWWFLNEDSDFLIDSTMMHALGPRCAKSRYNCKHAISDLANAVSMRALVERNTVPHPKATHNRGIFAVTQIYSVWRVEVVISWESCSVITYVLLCGHRWNDGRGELLRLTERCDQKLN